MIKNKIHIIIWWCCQSIHCKEKTSYDHGVQNVPGNSSKNLYLLRHENKVEFLQGWFSNKSFPCPQKEKQGFFRTLLFYLCFKREYLTLKCRILALKTTAWWMHSSHFVETITTQFIFVSPWKTPCSSHNMVGPGRGSRRGETLCDDVNNGCMGD